MKTTYIIISLFFIFFCVTENKFEGELIYHYKMNINSIDFSKSKKNYDTIKFIYKNKNYIKSNNKIDFEKEIFIDSLKKVFVIYKDNLSKSKNLSMNEDNLNGGKMYNRENSHFGGIISSKISDTLIQFKNKNFSLKKLELKRKYGNEIYVYSEIDSLKLSDNRNILRNIGEQIHPKEIAENINNSILYYYKLTANNLDGYIEYSLVDIKNIEVQDNIFNIPKHKDAKGSKKENMKNGRFKFYEIID